VADDLDPAAVERVLGLFDECLRWEKGDSMRPVLVPLAHLRVARDALALAAAGPLVTPEHDALPGCTGEPGV